MGDQASGPIEWSELQDVKGPLPSALEIDLSSFLREVIHFLLLDASMELEIVLQDILWRKVGGGDKEVPKWGRLGTERVSGLAGDEEDQLVDVVTPSFGSEI